MDLNILKIYVDRSGRVYSTSNLSLTQYSNNNRISLYYDTDSKYDNIEISFRKPDGWVSTKRRLIFDYDDEGLPIAYYDIPEDITDFNIIGQTSILTANLYFQYKNEQGQNMTAAIGNIRIAVQYIDSTGRPEASPEEIDNYYIYLSNLEKRLGNVEGGNITAVRAVHDGAGNIITEIYETKLASQEKYKFLNDHKLDKGEVEDQTKRLEILETGMSVSTTRLNSIETDLTTNNEITTQNKSDIDALRETTVNEEEFNTAINERKTAEINLQNQIDSLHQSSVFKEMVENRDAADKLIGTLKDGDRVLVLDTNQVLRWTESINDFEDVGSYGSPTYTKAEIDAEHLSIKNSIPNKATLANGELKLSKGNIPISTEQVKVKTVNGESIWGEGNIVIPVDSEFSTTSTNPVENRLITNILSSKADQSSIESVRTQLSNKADKTELNNKQDKLKAGANVTITEDGLISVDSAIKLKKVTGELNDIPMNERRTNIIYLYKPVNETTYSEFLWDEIELRWEPFGEAGLHLEKYYDMLQVDALLSEKASKEDFNNLDAEIAVNTAELLNKADRETTNTSINTLNSAVLNLQSAVSNKAEKTYVDDNFAKIYDVPETYQEKLINGLNIKTINGINILGSGDLGIVDNLTDLSVYYTKEEADPKFALKTELFDKDYTKLINKPELGIYRLINDSYSKEEVDEAIAAADISEKLTEYYNKEEVDELIQNVDISEELENYATKDYVADAVAAVDVSEQLKSYATKVDVANTYLTQTNASIIYATRDTVDKINLRIPTKVSGLSNDLGYITSADIPKDLSKYENTPGFLTAESTAFKNKQDKLVSGTNIKTINGESILGDGNIKIITDVSNLETKNDAENKLANAKAYTDTAKQGLQTSITQNTTLINALRSDLTNEVSARSSGDAQTLASAKTYTDTTIREVIEDTEGALEAIKEIKEQIGSGESGVGGILSSINNNKTDIANVRRDLEAEIELRETADTLIQESISGNTEDIKSLQTQINTEIQNRTTGDNALSGRIDKLNTSFEAHKTSANDSLVELNNKITAEEAARIAEDTNIYSVLDNFTAQSDIKIANVQGTVNELNTRVNTAQKDINDHKKDADTRFAEIEEQIGVKILFKNWVS